jgi:Predicted O-methyltransferase
MILATDLHEKIVNMKSTSSVRPGEGEHLSYLAAQVPHKGVIVELGSFQGKSTCYLAAGVRQQGRRVRIYCVDLWDLGVYTPNRHHDPMVFQKFQEHLQSLGLWEDIRPIKSNTVAAAMSWSKPVDLLFIDAGHRYEEVCADFYAWSKFVKTGGVIAFHDYVPGQHDAIVRVVQEELLPSGCWDFLSLYDSVWSARKKSRE